MNELINLSVTVPSARSRGEVPGEVKVFTWQVSVINLTVTMLAL